MALLVALQPTGVSIPGAVELLASLPLLCVVQRRGFANDWRSWSLGCTPPNTIVIVYGIRKTLVVHGFCVCVCVCVSV
eukprot:12322545-Alexandrium_andersonii.AAC.1